MRVVTLFPLQSGGAGTEEMKESEADGKLDIGAATTATPTEAGTISRMEVDEREEAEILAKAEQGAEKQAAARETMLQMATAFEDMLAFQKRMNQALATEEQRTRLLQEENAAMASELEDLRIREERRKLAEWNRLLRQNSTQFKTVLCLSRRALPVNLLDTGRPVEKLLEGEPSRGDSVTLSWVLKLWAHEARKRQKADEMATEPLEVAVQTEVELPDPDLEDELRRTREEMWRLRSAQSDSESERARWKEMLLEAEERARKAEEDRKAMEKEMWLAKAQAMDKDEQWRKALEELEKQRLAKELLEKERADLEEALKAEQERQAQQADMANASRQKDDRIAELERLLAEQQEAFSRERGLWDKERASLQETIRNVNQELQDAVIHARNLQQMAHRAKRSAAGGVSPEEMAQLIQDLEHMRDRLSEVSLMARRAKDENLNLKKKLTTKNRQLELERQFLPLGHRVKGPISGKHMLLPHETHAASWSNVQGAKGGNERRACDAQHFDGGGATNATRLPLLGRSASSGAALSSTYMPNMTVTSPEKGISRNSFAATASNMFR
eukprot:TRINITY_DN111267_c0_g1_i1.p1 TRINITY_DN111267_c0_g1~~TRINITY_DN111267_c0_g1_i1.p1  ORF type:complete len:560 (-),score=200.47 TRINITY_DN111267_c0_g1_i1:197-1876(-)